MAKNTTMLVETKKTMLDYLPAGKMPKEIPAGKILVHNSVRPSRRIGDKALGLGGTIRGTRRTGISATVAGVPNSGSTTWRDARRPPGSRSVGWSNGG